MAKKVIQMYDKYKSTTKIYPKVIKESFQDDAKEYIEGQVVANPELAGTEAGLTSLEVGGTKYKVEQPINVVANPTLAGTEDNLTGLQVGDTKYKVPSGGGGSTRYLHKICVFTSNNIYALINIENSDNTVYNTKAKLSQAIYNKGATTRDSSLIATGQHVTEAGNPVYCVCGVYSSDGSSFAVVRYHPTVGNTSLIDYILRQSRSPPVE